MKKLGRSLRRLVRRKKPENDPPPESERPPPTMQEITVDDFKNPVPLIVSDAVKGVQKETRALLFSTTSQRGGLGLAAKAEVSG